VAHNTSWQDEKKREVFRPSSAPGEEVFRVKNFHLISFLSFSCLILIIEVYAEFARYAQNSVKLRVYSVKLRGKNLNFI